MKLSAYRNRGGRVILLQSAADTSAALVPVCVSCCGMKSRLNILSLYTTLNTSNEIRMRQKARRGGKERASIILTFR